MKRAELEHSRNHIFIELKICLAIYVHRCLKDELHVLPPNLETKIRNKKKKTERKKSYIT